jgi:putative transposase
LTDNQWQVIEKLVTGKVRGLKHSLRSILNEIFYLVKIGCQWRMLPSSFAPWTTFIIIIVVNGNTYGSIEELHEMLRDFPVAKLGII